MRQPRLDGKALRDYVTEAEHIIHDAVDRHQPAGVYALFSGGSDSTTMLDIARRTGRLDGVIHVNTTIGIRATREFVRQVCADWQLPLIEQAPPQSYAEIVRERGFFGPKDHGYAYRLLKKEAIRIIKRRLLTWRGQDKLMFLTGMRSAESDRRMAHGAADRLEERIWWINPIRDFTSDTMAEYRESRPDLPVNPVGRALGRSGECLCGCFAVRDVELPIVRELDPDTADLIESLEQEVGAAGSPFCRWGPGGTSSGRPAGPMCVGCDEAQLFDPEGS